MMPRFAHTADTLDSTGCSIPLITARATQRWSRSLRRRSAARTPAYRICALSCGAEYSLSRRVAEAEARVIIEVHRRPLPRRLS